jgi:hypothetical protein
MFLARDGFLEKRPLEGKITVGLNLCWCHTCRDKRRVDMFSLAEPTTTRNDCTKTSHILLHLERNNTVERAREDSQGIESYMTMTESPQHRK